MALDAAFHVAHDAASHVAHDAAFHVALDAAFHVAHDAAFHVALDAAFHVAGGASRDARSARRQFSAEATWRACRLRRGRHDCYGRGTAPEAARVGGCAGPRVALTPPGHSPPPRIPAPHRAPAASMPAS